MTEIRESNQVNDERGLRSRIYSNIQSCNRYMTNEYMDKKTLLELLPWIHPSDRKEFKLEIEEQNS